MIGLDTNVLARFFLQDDPIQSAQAAGFIATLSPRSQGYVSAVVLAELYWLLRRRYSIARPQALDAFSLLLNSADVAVEDYRLAAQALEIARSSQAEFTDVLIALRNREAGCSHTVTFDKRASKLADMRLLS